MEILPINERRRRWPEQTEYYNLFYEADLIKMQLSLSLYQMHLDALLDNDVRQKLSAAEIREMYI